MAHSSSYDTHTKICWALIDDTLRNISDFANHSQRPHAICPVCKEPVVLKMGERNRHHFAHKSSSSCCPARRPETALHFNTKVRIGELLNKLAGDQRVLWVEQACKRECGNTRRKRWMQGWDRSEVEYSVQPIRPDISLLKEGRVIAVIEVFVSHAVDAQKATRFAENGIQWIEVRASDLGDWQPGEPLPYLRLHPNPFEWQLGEPLPYLRLYPTPSDWWECQQCQEEEKQERERIQQREIEEKQSKEQRWQREMQALVQKSREFREERLRDEREKQLVIEQRAKEMGETAKIEDSILSGQRLGICKRCGVETRDWDYYEYATGVCICRSCHRKQAITNGKP